MNNNADEISQAEKRRIMIEKRRLKTYHGHAQAAIDDERQGRFATLDKPTVIGQAAGPIYPAQPAGSPWHSDPCPPEPSLGYSVDEQEPVGEKFEQAASSAQDDTPTPLSTESHVITDAGVGRVKFPRRW